MNMKAKHPCVNARWTKNRNNVINEQTNKYLCFNCSISFNHTQSLIITPVSDCTLISSLIKYPMDVAIINESIVKNMYIQYIRGDS